jgi:creatinine amidohydrolase
VIRPGLSPHHLGFPETITLEESTFQDVVEQSCRSLAETGFRKIILFCSHGGNWPSVHQAADRLRAAVSPTAEVILLSKGAVQQVEEEIYRFLSQRGISSAVAGVHAGLRETSHVLDIAPTSVRLNEAHRGWIGDSVVSELAAGKRIQDFSPTGILGDAGGGTPNLGIQLNELVVTLYTTAIRKEMTEDRTQAEIEKSM